MDMFCSSGFSMISWTLHKLSAMLDLIAFQKKEKNEWFKKKKKSPQGYSSWRDPSFSEKINEGNLFK